MTRLLLILGAAMSATNGEMMPPREPEAELACLCAVVRGEDADRGDDYAHAVFEAIRPEYFYESRRADLFRLARELYDAGQPRSPMILHSELVRRGWPEDDARGLISATLDYATDWLAPQYIGMVRRAWMDRSVIDACHGLMRDAYRRTRTGPELVSAGEMEFRRIADAECGSGLTSARDAAAAAMERITNRGAGIPGLTTGLFGLDDRLDGLRPGRVYILAARTSVGKSALALSITNHVAITSRRPTLFVSLEMEHADLAQRLLQQRAGVSGDDLKSPSAATLAALGAAYDDMAASPLEIDDRPGRTMTQIGAAARTLRARSGLGLVVIDYVGLVAPEETRNVSRQEQVARISGSIKNLARELAVPVLALVQVNRQAEAREGHKPRLADLRDSGSQEQDADAVVLMHRPDYHGDDSPRGYCSLIVAKNRMGPTGVAHAHFDRARQSFATWDEMAHGPLPADGRDDGGRNGNGDQKF